MCNLPLINDLQEYSASAVAVCFNNRCIINGRYFFLQGIINSNLIVVVVARMYK